MITSGLIIISFVKQIPVVYAGFRSRSIYGNWHSMKLWEIMKSLLTFLFLKFLKVSEIFLWEISGVLAGV